MSYELFTTEFTLNFTVATDKKITKNDVDAINTALQDWRDGRYPQEVEALSMLLCLLICRITGCHAYSYEDATFISVSRQVDSARPFGWNKR